MLGAGKGHGNQYAAAHHSDEGEQVEIDTLVALQRRDSQQVNNPETITTATVFSSSISDTPLCAQLPSITLSILPSVAHSLNSEKCCPRA